MKTFVKDLIITLDDLIRQIEDFFWVETKDSDVIPFKLNNKQQQLFKAIKKQKKQNEKKPLRIIILKGRQFGFSTFILALFFVKCLLVPNTRAVVISHTEDATKKLFRRVKFFSKTFVVKPTLDKESEKEYGFPRTNSYFYIGTAGNRTFGRGDNITDLHCSEVAFWENPGRIMNGLLQAVGKTGNVFIETTANGMGNYLYRVFWKSWNKIGASWKALFFSWTDFEEYEMDTPEDFKRTKEEEHVVKLHLSKYKAAKANRKLVWRRWKIDETETDGLLTPEDLFKQEYPFTPQEAFISSGRPVFSQKALLAYKTKKGDTEGNLTIFKKPVPGRKYIIGGDVAEDGENNDWSTAQVLDYTTLEQVAIWRGHIDPDLFADELVIVGELYNNAYIGVEVNNQGLTTLTELKKKYPRELIYYREVLDEAHKKRTKKIGWKTDMKTRPLMVGELIKCVREHLIGINCARTVQECLTFVKDKKGKPQAQEGCNDDTVIALAIAYQMFKAFSLVSGSVVEIQASHGKTVEGKDKKWNKVEQALITGDYFEEDEI